MTRTQYSKAALARDDGLRRVRKITWRIGLLSVALATVIGAKFAHITAALPHLSTSNSSSSAGTSSTGTGTTSPSGSSASSGGAASSGTSSSGISSSSGVSSSSGGGVTTSGGS